MIQRRGFSIRQDDSSVLSWVVLLVIASALLSGWLVASRLEPSDGQQRGGLTVLRSWLGAPGPRPRLGFQPAPAPELATVDTASAMVAGQREGTPLSVPASSVASAEQPSTAPAQAVPRPDGALRSGQSAVVANTEGVGVVLRSEPRDNARVPRGLLEGTRVTVLERAGDTWVRVRAENGQEGWVPATYLRPLP